MTKEGLMIFVEIDKDQTDQFITDFDAFCKERKLVWAVTEMKPPQFEIFGLEE